MRQKDSDKNRKHNAFDVAKGATFIFAILSLESVPYFYYIEVNTEILYAKGQFFPVQGSGNKSDRGGRTMVNGPLSFGQTNRKLCYSSVISAMLVLPKIPS